MAVIYNDAGLISEKAKRPKLAIDRYRGAMMLDPSSTITHLNLAEILWSELRKNKKREDPVAKAEAQKEYWKYYKEIDPTSLKSSVRQKILARCYDCALKRELQDHGEPDARLNGEWDLQSYQCPNGKLTGGAETINSNLRDTDRAWQDRSSIKVTNGNRVLTEWVSPHSPGSVYLRRTAVAKTKAGKLLYQEQEFRYWRSLESFAKGEEPYKVELFKDDELRSYKISTGNNGKRNLVMKSDDSPLEREKTCTQGLLQLNLIERPSL